MDIVIVPTIFMPFHLYSCWYYPYANFTTRVCTGATSPVPQTLTGRYYAATACPEKKYSDHADTPFDSWDAREMR